MFKPILKLIGVLVITLVGCFCFDQCIISDFQARLVRVKIGDDANWIDVMLGKPMHVKTGGHAEEYVKHSVKDSAFAFSEAKTLDDMSFKKVKLLQYFPRTILIPNGISEGIVLVDEEGKVVATYLTNG